MKGACAALALALALFVRPGQVIIRLPTPALTLLTPSSGVVGASITITGTNFGGRGNGFVTVNGSPATIVSWAATSITITIPNTTTGPVIVTQNGLPSNSLTLTIGGSTGTTFYVAQTGGLDSRTCTQAQTITTPKQTIASGIACLSAGTTLLVRAGTYVETLVNNLPSGTAWTDLVRIAAYPGETVTLAPTGVSEVIYIGNSAQYVEFDGINIDGAGVSDAALSWPTSDHIRFKNADVHHREGPGNTNAAIGVGGHDNEFLNLTVHGTGGPYGFYVSGNTNLIDSCDIYNTSTAGVHIYLNGGFPTGNIVRNSRIHDITESWFFGTPSASLWGILVAGHNNQVYNNQIYNNILPYQSGNAGILVFYGDNNQIYNNTIINNTTDGIVIASSVDGTDNTIVANNIVYTNTTDTIVDGGIGTTQQTNLLGIDPLFVNYFGLDFHLTASSPALNTGTTNTVATSDPDGVPRPTGAAFDIGAYERGAPVITLLTPNSGAVGASVVITGTGFGAIKGSATVTFNSVTATTTAWSTTSITATVPTTTTGPVIVTQNGLTSAGVTFTVTGAASGTACADAVTAGTILYAKPAASGTGNGSSWTNALALPNTTGFVRGKVYCTAGGSYSGRTLSTANSGTTPISIVHATVADHGTATGWSDSLGTTVTTFTDTIDVNTSNWTFDGQTGGGPGSWDAGHGIVIQLAISGGQDHAIGLTAGATIANLTFKHVSVGGRGRNYGSGDTDLIYSTGGGWTNLLISYCYFHDTDRTMMLSWPSPGNGTIIEYSLYARNGAVEHREAWSFGPEQNVTIRYNLFEDIYGTGFLAGVNNTGTALNWDVYGNVFYWSSLTNTVTTIGGPDAGSHTGVINTGIFVCGNGGGSFNIACTNWHVYNNAFLNIRNPGFTTGFDRGGGGTNFVVENNIWYNNQSASSANGTTTDYNWFYNNSSNGTSGSHDVVGTANPFAIANPWDTRAFALRQAISGLALTAPYDHDYLGILRGGDGVWDRGPLEFP